MMRTDWFDEQFALSKTKKKFFAKCKLRALVGLYKMQKFKATLIKDQITSNDTLAHALHKKTSIGTKLNQKISFSVLETLYLLQKNLITLENFQGKPIPQKTLEQKFSKKESAFHQKYLVFEDLTQKGYLVKTALKFGSDFRIYKKNQPHSIWICQVISGNKKISSQDFQAKTRIANSTNKPLLLAIVDEENSITYYEIKRIKI